MTARLGKPEEAIKFSRQHLANCLWAMATLELLPSGRLLAAVAEAMKERANDCNPQEISNTVWAFAKLGGLWCDLGLWENLCLWDTAVDSTRKRPGACNSQQSSITVGPCAKLGDMCALISWSLLTCVFGLDASFAATSLRLVFSFIGINCHRSIC